MRKDILNVDEITFTSYTGKKERVPFEFFDIGTIRTEVSNHLTNHNSCINAFKQMPDHLKWKFYYDYLFNAEMQICNWKGLKDAFFQQYPLHIQECEGYDDYRPILSDEVLLAIHNITKEYDNHKITFQEYLERRKEHLQNYFPKEWKSDIQKKKITQSEVNEMLNRCKQNHNYELTSDELDMFNATNWSMYSTRWISRQLNSLTKLDVDTHFNRFELSCIKKPQPIRNLCATFNRQLDTHNINADDDDLRVQNLEVRMHPIISQKIEDMFTDWYRKKYLGLERITKTLIDNEKHIITSKTKATVVL